MDYLSNHFITAIEAANGKPIRSNSVPFKRSNKNSSLAPWWNAECHQAALARKTALRNFRKCSSFPNYLLLKKHEALAKKTFSAARKKSWKKFCSEIQFKTSFEKIWSY